MKKNSICQTITIVAIAAAVGLGGCSRQPIEDEKPLVPKKPTNAAQAPVAPIKPGATTKPSSAQPPQAPNQAAVNASSLAELEAIYTSRSDVMGKMEAITKICDVGGASAVTSLARLFQMEKDPSIRQEIVSSLYDIDGQDEAKASFLGLAVASAQPQDVREEAISALEDVEPKLAMPILQSLLNDPNEDIRDNAKDAIELLDAISKGAK